MRNYDKCISNWKENKNSELMDKIYMKLTYSSNKIENNETHIRDVKKIFESKEIKDFNGDPKTLIEIENHKKLYRELNDLINTKTSISISIIKEFHKKLMNNCMPDTLLEKGEVNGEFKKGDYVVGLHDVGECPENVEDSLTSLLEEINEVEITDRNVLKVASYFHCWFETIHPFADGNGRVGRLLLNYFLMLNDYPPIIIFNTDKAEYYEALEEFSESQEIKKMVEFLDKESYNTWLKDYNKKIKSLSSFI